MQLYKTTLTPESHFMTTLKGDTLFGQLCWSIRHLYGEERLTALLADYKETPFLVVSDAFVQGHLPKPRLPGVLLGEESSLKKTNRKKVWLTLDDLQKGAYSKAKSDKALDVSDKNLNEMHNALNYKTFNTGDDGFDPFGLEVSRYGDKDIYLLMDESKITKDELQNVLLFMGEYGYGKKSSSGKGRFSAAEFDAIALDNNSKTFMTLSPSTLKGIKAELFYEPFTRFGKFGADRAHKNAFKKPILLADSAAVLHFENKKHLQYIGSGITDISNVHKDTVHQGYAIVVPIKEIA